MQIIATSLPEVLIVELDARVDARGFFIETYHERKFHDLGITNRFVQDNHSLSGCGTLRGLHYQLHHPQAKLCRVTSGQVLDVTVDIRRGSPTFARWTSVLLTAENRRQVLVPRGFAHGFLVLSETAEFLYKCDDFYDAADERGLAWDDPTLAIDWQLEALGVGEPLLSLKDRANRPLAEAGPEHLPLYPAVVGPVGLNSI